MEMVKAKFKVGSGSGSGSGSGTEVGKTISPKLARLLMAPMAAEAATSAATDFGPGLADSAGSVSTGARITLEGTLAVAVGSPLKLQIIFILASQSAPDLGASPMPHFVV